MTDDKKIKLIVEWTFDKSDFIDSEETLQSDYDGSWQRVINELIKCDGLFEILTWSDYEPKLVGIEYTQHPQSKERKQ